MLSTILGTQTYYLSKNLESFLAVSCFIFIKLIPFYIKTDPFGHLYSLDISAISLLAVSWI